MNIEWKDGRLDLAYRDLKTLSLPFLEAYTSDATHLDLSGNFFVDLPWLSEFRILKTLILDDNKINSASKLGKISSLHTLCVNRNLIEDLDLFLDVVCKSFPNIRYLSMLNNAACPNFLNQGSLRQYNEYRIKVISRLPNLLFLDSSKVTDSEKHQANASASASLYSQAESETRSSVRFSEILDTDDPSIIQRRQAYGSEARSGPNSESSKSARRRSSTRKITVPSSQSAANSPLTQPANSLAPSTSKASFSTPNSPQQGSSNRAPDLTSRGILLTTNLKVEPTTAYMEEVVDPPVVNRFHRPSVDETSLSLQIALSLRPHVHKDLYHNAPEPPPLVLPEVSNKPLVLAAAPPPPPPPLNHGNRSYDDWSDGD